MTRFPTSSARRIAMLASGSRNTITTPVFQNTSTSAPRYYSNGNTSSPKSAEEPSATSGGSRSKEAVETGSSPTAGSIPDARGRTGGGSPLESSQHAPAKPKISNASVPGHKPNLTAEQQAEVDEHNKSFEEKHGLAQPAGDDKVNKSFWSGRGSRYNKP